MAYRGAVEGSDEQLAAAVMGGDTAALSMLVARYHEPLLGFLLRLVGGDRMIAEDLTQETFLRVLSQRSFQPQRPFRPWLYAVAANLVRDHRRSERRRPRADANVGELELADAAAGPEQRALNAEAAAAMAAALALLPDDLRVVLVLRYCQDLPLAEVADAVGAPVGTVKSRLFTATRRLRQLVEAHDIEVGR
jgi:RNA polymerase sigma-70 factor, ECF subfamily